MVFFSVFFSTWKTQSFTWKKSKKVPVKRKNVYVKTKNSKNVCVKPKKCAWKCLKCQKSARESKKLCVKTVEKVCVKANFCAWKKLKKGQKIVSRTLLVFTWKKKTLVMIIVAMGRELWGSTLERTIIDVVEAGGWGIRHGKTFVGAAEAGEGLNDVGV